MPSSAPLGDIVRGLRDGGGTTVLVANTARLDTLPAHPEWVSVDGFHPSTAGAVAVAAAFERALTQVAG